MNHAGRAPAIQALFMARADDNVNVGGFEGLREEHGWNRGKCSLENKNPTFDYEAMHEAMFFYEWISP